LKQLDGEWEIESVVVDGTKRPAVAPAEERVVIRDGKWAVKSGEKVLDKGSFTIDPTKRPMSMDISRDDGGTLLAIVEIDDGSYKVCMTAPGKDVARPTKFTAEKDSGYALATYKRIK
jgi:uncharacterized protein (TIGR03067 family)